MESAIVQGVVHIEEFTNVGKWKMDIDLQGICRLEGKKETVFGTDRNWNSGVRKNITIYPKSKVKKLFKLMVDHLGGDELDQIEKYLKDHSKTYADLFNQVRWC